MVIKEVIDHITGVSNDYRRFQPEQDLLGRYGNGWRGVWRWCEANAGILDKILEWLGNCTDREDILITIPCDSTDTWIVAAYQNDEDVEELKNPWEAVFDFPMKNRRTFRKNGEAPAF